MADVAIATHGAPRWELNSVYPYPAHPDVGVDVERARGGVAKLRASVVAFVGGPPAAERLAVLLGAYADVADRCTTLRFYAHGLVTASSGDEAAESLEQCAIALAADLASAIVPLTLAMARWDDATLASVCADPRVAPDALFVRQIADEGRHMMSGPEEELALELGKSGTSAWQRLYRQRASALTFAWVDAAGAPTRVPVSMALGLLADPVRRVRADAFRALREAWLGDSVVLAATLNAVSGTQLALSRRRGDPGPLDASLRANRVDRRILDAMWSAVRLQIPAFRAFLRAKARALGVPRMAMYDLTAPVGTDVEPALPYADGLQFVVRAFGEFHAPLGEFAERANELHWIEAEARRGKSTGAYCMHLPKVREPRVFMTYSGRTSVRTLAHELGHAWHYSLMRDLPSTQQDLTMTIAETASTFAETLVTRLAIDHAGPSERAQLLNERATFLFNILPMILARYEFEDELYRRRAEGECSARDLEAMSRTHFSTVFGDDVEPASVSGHAWASTAHHFLWPYYNYPYAFGTLLSLGLYARWKVEGAAFVPKIESFLRETGRKTARELGDIVGVHFDRTEFWSGAVAQAVAEIAAFDAAVP